MKLYYSPTSPYVRKIMVQLAETGHSGALELVAVGGTPLDPGTMPVTKNPLGKIPALELDDGSAIYDSRVITRYLDDHFAMRLYPTAPDLWKTLTLEATADGILDAAILMVYEARVRPVDKQFDLWTEGQWQKIARALDAIEARWIEHLNGPLDMGVIGVACMLGYIDFRHGDRNWRIGREKLAAWDAAFAARSSMIATVPPK